MGLWAITAIVFIAVFVLLVVSQSSVSAAGGYTTITPTWNGTPFPTFPTVTFPSNPTITRSAPLCTPIRLATMTWPGYFPTIPLVTQTYNVFPTNSFPTSVWNTPAGTVTPGKTVIPGTSTPTDTKTRTITPTQTGTPGPTNTATVPYSGDIEIRVEGLNLQNSDTASGTYLCTNLDTGATISGTLPITNPSGWLVANTANCYVHIYGGGGNGNGAYGFGFDWSQFGSVNFTVYYNGHGTQNCPDSRNDFSPVTVNSSYTGNNHTAYFTTGCVTAAGYGTVDWYFSISRYTITPTPTGIFTATTTLACQAPIAPGGEPPIVTFSPLIFTNGVCTQIMPGLYFKSSALGLGLPDINIPASFICTKLISIDMSIMGIPIIMFLDWFVILGCVGILYKAFSR
jgi:hypothetical protein